CKLAERFGKRKVFLTSVALFTLASLGCAMANNIYTLILLRILQAAGGAGFTPTATGIIVDNFGSSRDRYVSLFGSIFPIGAMAGPIFGGYFVTYWSWRDIFHVNAPIGLLIFLCAWRFLPRNPPQPARKPISVGVVGIPLLGGGLMSGMPLIGSIGEGYPDKGPWQFLLLALFSLTMIVGFFRHMQRAKAHF